jgi:hypothetical protein
MAPAPPMQAATDQNSGMKRRAKRLTVKLQRIQKLRAIRRERGPKRGRGDLMMAKIPGLPMAQRPALTREFSKTIVRGLSIQPGAQATAA